MIFSFVLKERVSGTCYWYGYIFPLLPAAAYAAAIFVSVHIYLFPVSSSH